jgi:site-specific DNA-methyltransferase (adenine-specific)
MMIVEQMLKNAPNPLLHIADVSGSALFQGDCLDIMPLIPDKSVQLILADLPFNTEKRTTWNDWDKKIDLIKLWENYDRVLVDNGCVILFGYGLFAHQLANS